MKSKFEIILNGESLDLPPKFTFTRIEKNQSLVEGVEAEFTYPMTLPPTAKNNRLFGYFLLPESNQRARYFDVEFIENEKTNKAQLRLWKGSYKRGYEINLKLGSSLNQVMELPLSSLPLATFPSSDLYFPVAAEGFWPEKPCCFPMIFWPNYFGDDLANDPDQKNEPYYSGIINQTVENTGTFQFNFIAGPSGAFGAPEGSVMNRTDFVPQIFVGHILETGFKEMGYRFQDLTPGQFLNNLFFLSNKGVTKKKESGLVIAYYTGDGVLIDNIADPGDSLIFPNEVEDADGLFSMNQYFAGYQSNVWEVTLEIELEGIHDYPIIPGSGVVNFYVGEGSTDTEFLGQIPFDFSTGDVVRKTFTKTFDLYAISPSGFNRVFASFSFLDSSTSFPHPRVWGEIQSNFNRVEIRNVSRSKLLDLPDTIDLSDCVPEWTFGQFIDKIKSSLPIVFDYDHFNGVVNMRGISSSVSSTSQSNINGSRVLQNISLYPEISQKQQSRFISHKRPDDPAYDEVDIIGVFFQNGIATEVLLKDLGDVDIQMQAEGAPLIMKKGSEIPGLDLFLEEYLPYTGLIGNNADGKVQAELKDLRLMYYRGLQTNNIRYSNYTFLRIEAPISPGNLVYSATLGFYVTSDPYLFDASPFHLSLFQDYLPIFQFLDEARHVEFEWFATEKELAEISINALVHAYDRLILQEERQIERSVDSLKVTVKARMQVTPLQ